MPPPRPLSAFATALGALLCLLTAHGCPTESTSRGGRSGHKLDNYYDCNSTEHRLNTTQLNWLASPLTTLLLPTVYSVVLLVGLPANGLAIWVLAVKIKKVPSSLFLLNLATADLFFILVLPFKISYYFLGNNWHFGEALCRMTTAFFYANMYCSILFLMCISADRYFSLVHPFKARGAQGWSKSLFISLGVWVIVAAALIPFLLVQQTITFSNVPITTCHDVTTVCYKEDWLFYYMLGLAIVGFVIPFAIVLFCNGSILLTLASKRGNHRRVIWLILLVLGTFLLCFTPSNFLYFYQAMDHSPERRNQLYNWYTLALGLGSLNSCIDPFIYYFTSWDFRQLVKATVCGQKENKRVLSGRTSEPLLQKKTTINSQ